MQVELPYFSSYACSFKHSTLEQEMVGKGDWAACNNKCKSAPNWDSRLVFGSF